MNKISNSTKSVLVCVFLTFFCLNGFSQTNLKHSDVMPDIYPTSFVKYQVLIMEIPKIDIDGTMEEYISHGEINGEKEIKKYQKELEKMNDNIEKRNMEIPAFLEKYEINAKIIKPSELKNYEAKEFPYVAKPELVKIMVGHHEHFLYTYHFSDRLKNKDYAFHKSVSDRFFFKEMSKYQLAVLNKLKLKNVEPKEIEQHEKLIQEIEQEAHIKAEKHRKIGKGVFWGFGIAGLVVLLIVVNSAL